MPRQVETFGNVTRGQLNIPDRPAFLSAVGTLPEGMVSITVKVVGKTRSNNANRYYRGVVCKLLAEAISDNWGEDVSPDDVHHMLKERFNLRVIETANGTVTLPGSTARLATDEFARYIEKCRAWAASFWGIDIPDPVKIEKANKPLLSA